MGDVNPIRTLGDYSKPSHEGCRNTIELLVRNNVEDETKEEGNVKTSTTQYKDHEITVESEEEFGEETEDKIKEEEGDNPNNFDTFHTMKELRAIQSLIAMKAKRNKGKVT
nr:hypothetical protein [Tanacetum cinerariifolium]